MTHLTSSTPGNGPIDVLAEPYPTARTHAALSLALIEEIDQARGAVPRSRYLAHVIDAAMTRTEPRIPDVADGEKLTDALADRRYRQHVRSIELRRRAEASR
jgi:hypothetical protein